jgi:ABC-type sugar transport system substrate-binding protein
VGFEVIRILDAANIKTFLAFSGLREQSERLLATVPRLHFPGWLGSLEPRAEEAGYLTARALIQYGQQNQLQGSDGRLHMLAIAGDRSTPASLKRNEGMRRAVAEAKDVIVDQEVYAEWSRAKAQEQSEWLFQRHPQARLIWAGSDLMAFGAMDSWKNKGGQPGKDAYFSAVNTSSEALAALESGSLTALAGGHLSLVPLVL